MLQPIANPQPLFIPTRTSPNVVSSSRQLVPLGTVEIGGIQFYKFNTGSEPFTAHKFYPVTIIQEINPMVNEPIFGHIAHAFSSERPQVAETVEAEPAAQDTAPVAGVETVVEVAPVVETDSDEVGAKFVRWLASNSDARERAEKEIAALETRGWTCRGMAAANHQGMGEYCVLYVRPQLAVQS